MHLFTLTTQFSMETLWRLEIGGSGGGGVGWGGIMVGHFTLINEASAS